MSRSLFLKLYTAGMIVLFTAGPAIPQSGAPAAPAPAPAPAPAAPVPADFPSYIVTYKAPVRDIPKLVREKRITHSLIVSAFYWFCLHDRK